MDCDPSHNLEVAKEGESSCNLKLGKEVESSCNLELGKEGESLQNLELGKVGGSSQILDVGVNVEVLDEEVNKDENEVVEPKIGMKFDHIDEMYELFRNYAKHVGFPVRKRTSKKYNGILKHVTFACGRCGKYCSKSQNPSQTESSYRIGCNAKLSGSLDLDEKWRITKLALDHNHELSPSESRYFRCNRKIDARKRRQQNEVEAGGPKNASFPEKDRRSSNEEAGRLQLGEGDAEAIQRYLTKMQAQKTGFYFNIDLDEKGFLKNVFWADGRSREAYKEFGEVVTFDTTYLTNKYDVPAALFVGVNHHGQSTLLGCGLLSSDNTETFVWLFSTWLACMSDHAPCGIITDQGEAMLNAIKMVFPNTRHRWCLWHLMKKLSKKLGAHQDYESISNVLKGVVYESQSPAEFEEKWSEMIEKYGLHKNEWLSGLYKERQRWVPCFVKTSFWAGMSITHRSESVHAFFDGYVNTKTTLKQFLEQYDIALRCKVEKEASSDHKSFSEMLPCATHYEIEKQIQSVYTISKFKEFQKELLGKMYCDLISIRDGDEVSEYDIREDVEVGEGTKRMMFMVSFQRHGSEVNCSCHRFEIRGILCRHALSVLIRNDVALLPDKYILRRWRKDVRRSYTRVKINYDGCDATPEQLRYDQLCLEFTMLADLSAMDHESCSEVLEWIAYKTKELHAKRLGGGSNPTPMSTDCEENASEDVLDLGMPPSKRLESSIPNKSRKRKNKAPSGGTVKDGQTSALLPCQVPVVTSTQEVVTLALTPAQESTYPHLEAPLLYTQQQLADYPRQFWNTAYGPNGINPILTNGLGGLPPPPVQGYDAVSSLGAEKP